jgi:two-component system chemotaxis sensor kinase CheA
VAEATIRLNVELLDSLMTLAGELVLSRNQLSEAVSSDDNAGIRAAAHRLSLVTSEVQSAVALTRMQPVGTLFAKFPRLVRDLGRDLGKQVQLKIEGGDVEIDKTILEGLSDPLTHMIRNSVDHGVEMPEVRTAAGKPALGTITLRASHQTGQVVIEIIDDGKGLPADKIGASSLAKGMITREQLDAMSDRDKIMLIFLPGVSTAEKVSNVSGRGVGMDVVKTNLDKLGGKIDIDSVVGQGTSFRIKLPLTLAIIPSLLVSSSGQRFALPQVSVGELIRIPAHQQAERIDRAGDGEVLLLRDRLVPLLHLREALDGQRSRETDRAMNVVLVNTGSFEYGLVVDDLHDTVEIVVKPLGRHLQSLGDYAGATILGDGQVAIILDVGGVAARAGLTADAITRSTSTEEEAVESQSQSLLLFHNGPGEQCAVPIELVTRVERIRPEQVEYLGGRRTMQYGDASLPLVALSDVASVGQVGEGQQWVVIVFERTGRPLGLLAAEPLDMIESHVALDPVTLRQPGVAGSAIFDTRTTLMLDIFELAALARPDATETRASAASVPPVDATAMDAPPATAATVLVAEDSDFFRGQIRRLIEGVGYQVLAASDGQQAWELLQQHPEVQAVATDLEMPRLDGLGLTRLIRADGRFDRLPVIALSSLAGEEEIARALAEGVTEYQVKLDQDDFLASIERALATPAAR